MSYALTKVVVLVGLPILSCSVWAAFAETEDLGNGFFHHGVATPASSPRGIVATVNGQGRNVVLGWLFDH